MTLVDTSVWIDHFRSIEPDLTGLLENGRVLCHPFVIGELACGQLRRRREVLTLLANLPKAASVGDSEALQFIELHGLMGQGLGWIDVHLLASAALSGGRFWTKDRRLAAAATRMGIAP